ncbi:hypothetical protein KTO58_27240 [Chitinophaga pendula]|uniref:hypothetical protein n=1 Tax=Chitinophaga TaxID=79328 RepID=UPI0012FD3B5D|nr:MULTISPECIES: hypothetical protein [Chitinophaga]UCJ07312.1 hypothetical protein KTO58_27240 [Chitinophaga pendula]
MKQLILLLGMMSTAYAVTAQDKTQGRIEYEIVLNLHANLKPDQQQFKEMIPETAVQKEVLYFNGDKSRLDRKSMEEMTSEEGAKIKIQTGDEDEIAIYTDGATDKQYSLQQKEGKKILVDRDKSDKKKGDDKAGGKEVKGSKTKVILGYTCYDVGTKRKGDNMTLWVTDELPFQGGPLGAYNDKAILGMDAKGMSVVAKKIDFVPVAREEVTLPAGVPVQGK